MQDLYLGQDVEVRRRHEWVQGTILQIEERDGVRKYFVDLRGYARTDASDPANWFSAAELRPASGYR